MIEKLPKFFKLRKFDALSKYPDEQITQLPEEEFL